MSFVTPSVCGRTRVLAVVALAFVLAWQLSSTLVHADSPNGQTLWWNDDGDSFATFGRTRL